jgi:hypothetical protein
MAPNRKMRMRRERHGVAMLEDEMERGWGICIHRVPPMNWEQGVVCFEKYLKEGGSVEFIGKCSW